MENLPWHKILFSAKMGRALACTEETRESRKGLKNSIYALFQSTILRPTGPSPRPEEADESVEVGPKSITSELTNRTWAWRAPRHIPAKVLWQPLGDWAKTLRRNSADGSSISSASGLTIKENGDQVLLSNLWYNSHLADASRSQRKVPLGL